MSKSLRSILLVGTIATLGGAGTSFAADTQTQQNADTWRASKLVGVAIYGPDNKSVGKIDDIIMGKDGKAQSVVIGVGGFLGVGQKDVAVPYEQVRFTDAPLPSASGAPAATAPAGGAMAPAANGGAGTATNSSAGNAMPPATDAPPPAAAPATGSTPAQSMGSMSSAKPGAYPDHGMIDMTYDQLKGAPDFKFAS